MSRLARVVIAHFPLLGRVLAIAWLSRSCD